MPVDAAIAVMLGTASSATLPTVLFMKGLRNVWMRRALPLAPGQKRAVGRAFTLRFVPGREDPATPEHSISGRSTRAAIEAMEPGVIVVAEAMGTTDAAIFGDILSARMKGRGVAALVTDAVIRDEAGVRATGFPVWCRGRAAPPSLASLTFVNWREPVGCDGVAVIPGDVLVGDDDGAIMIPAALVDEVAGLAVEQERLEAWIMSEVEKGAASLGLCPPDAATKARYEASSQHR